jgi:hypothetical protein
VLPIEFARQSNDGRITLVLNLAQGCEPVPTLWSLFNTRDLIDPRESFRNECRRLDKAARPHNNQPAQPIHTFISQPAELERGP